MIHEKTIYGEARISKYLPTLPAMRYLNCCLTAGWHRCNNKYHMRYKNGTSLVFAIQTVSGCGFINADGRKWFLEPDTLIFIPPDTPIEYQTIKKGKNTEWEFYWLNLDGNNVRSFAYNLWNDKNSLIQLQKPYISRNVFKELLKDENVSYNTEQHRSYQIGKLIDTAVDELYFNSDGLTDTPDVINSIIRYLQENYRNTVTLTQLSSMFYLSSNQIIRNFYTRTGYTPYEYLKRYRLMKACELLQSTDMPVKDIGRSVGYINNSHFTAQFHSLYGITPSEYRKSFFGT